MMIELIEGGLYGVIPVRIFECWQFPRESPSGGKYTDFPNLIKFGQDDFYVNFIETCKNIFRIIELFQLSDLNETKNSLSWNFLEI